MTLAAGTKLGPYRLDDGLLLSVENGATEPVKGLQPNEAILGWTSDNQIYVRSIPDPARLVMHVDKLNPHTGARTVWRDLSMPPIGGVRPDPPLITPDGKTFAFDYRMNLSDLYTVSRVR